MGKRSDSGPLVRKFTSTEAEVTLPSERDIVITRMFNAPRDVVFEAWTQADRVEQWWDPRGIPLATSEIDLRPGGAFRFVHRGPPGDGHVFAGTYREIVAPARLVFATPAPSGGETVGTLVFEEQDGQTRLTMTMACASQEARDMLIKFQVDIGTVRTLGNLARYLELADAEG